MPDLSDVFYETERFGRRVAETATFECEEMAHSYRVTATVTFYGEVQGFEYLVTRLRPVREPDEPAERPDDEVQAQLFASVRALAYACIDAGPLPRRHVSRRFVARGG